MSTLRRVIDRCTHSAAAVDCRLMVAQAAAAEHNAYRYLSEGSAGYHIDKLNGINIDAGIFLSYIGLFSFYQFDNWSYQPSYVSSNTPWYFEGMRIQIFPSDKLKIEPWIINGWQSYGKFKRAPGVGGQLLWRPNGSSQSLPTTTGARTRWASLTANEFIPTTANSSRLLRRPNLANNEWIGDRG